jgi:hypothetical protein
MILSIVLATSLLAAAPSRNLYLGDVKGEWIDIQLRVGGDQVLGATWRPYQKTLRLVTGTANNGHVVLHEWSSPGVETATIDATITKKALRGKWGGKPFDFWPGGSESPLANEYQIAWPAFDRLHDEIFTGRWEAATFDARLACALSDEGCEWLASLPAIASGKFDRRPWRDAAANLTACDQRWRRMSCLFVRDLLPQFSAAERKEKTHHLCERYRLVCADDWGALEVALSDAAKRGDAAEVEKILRSHPNVNAGSGLLWTPLQSAIFARSLPAVKLLIEHGADPNLDRSGPGVPIESAVLNRVDDVAIYLLDHGARPVHGELWTAIDNGNHVLARKLLEKGADVNQDFPAGSALTDAVDKRDLTMVRELLAHCGDPNLTTKFSEGSPIDHARKLGAKKILALLLAPRDPGCAPLPIQ